MTAIRQDQVQKYRKDKAEIDNHNSQADLARKQAKLTEAQIEDIESAKTRATWAIGISIISVLATLLTAIVGLLMIL